MLFNAIFDAIRVGFCDTENLQSEIDTIRMPITHKYYKIKILKNKFYMKLTNFTIAIQVIGIVSGRFLVMI